MNKSFIKIPVHSVIDVITNSSTEIFCQSTSSTIDVITSIIQEFDMSIDVDKSFKFDLFPEDWEVYDIVQDKYDEYVDENNLSDSVEFKEYKELESNGRHQWVESIVGSPDRPDWFNSIDFLTDHTRDLYLNVIALDDKAREILPLVNKLISMQHTYEIDECYN